MPPRLPAPHPPAPERDALPAEPTHARRFGKTRTAQSTALLEDYAELIGDLLAAGGEARPTDIARRIGVSHATVIKTIARLKREGLATSRPYRGVFLTETGEHLAARVRARHRLVVDVLLAVSKETGKTVTQVALNWLLSRPSVANLVVGARNEEQLKQNLGAVGWKLDQAHVDKLDAASSRPPAYPYWHQMGFDTINPKPVKW